TGTTWCNLTQARDCVPLPDIAGQLHSHSARKLLRHASRGQPMSTEDKPEKPGEEKSANWHRGRAKRLREQGEYRQGSHHCSCRRRDFLLGIGAVSRNCCSSCALWPVN